MPVLSGKQALLDILREEEVRFIFGNPGTTELPLMDALVREKEIRYILALHECVAMSMADGYAQASGKLAVVNCHVSPGLGNAMGMLYNAARSGAPILVTAGQHDQSFTATEPILWSELPAIAQPFVKWSGEVRQFNDLPRLVHRAAKTALAHPTGPVFLSLPVDILNAEGPVEKGTPSRVSRRMVGDATALQEAAALLAGAKRPLLIVGDWVAHADAIGEVVALAESLGAEVMSECFAGVCSFPFQHPLHAGPMPRPTPRIREKLSKYDVVLAICAPVFTLALPSEEGPLPEGLTLLHLDVNPWEIGKNYPVAVGIQGDPKATVPELTLRIRKLAGSGFGAVAARRLEDSRALRESARAELARKAEEGAQRTPMSQLAFAHAIAKSVSADAVIVDESVSISSSGSLRYFLPCADAKSFFGPRGGGVGWGIPAALGVKLALPHRPVIALIGDGSAMYSWQGLWTSVHDHIPVVFIIVNNGCYRILKERAHALKGYGAADGVYVGMDIDEPPIDFVALAAAMGVSGESVLHAADLTAAIKRGVERNEPYVIDVRVDPSN
jgi:benzoylformate decarboxylase